MLKPQQIEQFQNDGFLVVEGFVEAARVRRLAERFSQLFRGDFETGIQPDEWNWREGRDANDLTRQICNGWKADRYVAETVLREDIGQYCAQLRDWPGARINQDNVIWKPPGAKALGFHQDESYQTWNIPGEMMTCWMTLDATRAGHGTIEYVRGSHLWDLSGPIQQFHAPEDPLSALKSAAGSAALNLDELDIVAIEVPAGSAVFHHGRTWHGSRCNDGGRERRSVVSHCISSESVFHPDNKSAIYSRYQHAGDETMSESFFPVLWDRVGYRTPWLDTYCAGPVDPS